MTNLDRRTWEAAIEAAAKVADDFYERHLKLSRVEAENGKELLGRPQVTAYAIAAAIRAIPIPPAPPSEKAVVEGES